MHWSAVFKTCFSLSICTFIVQTCLCPISTNKVFFPSWLFQSVSLFSPPSAVTHTHTHRRWVQWQQRTVCVSCRRWWSCPVSSRKNSCHPEPFRSSPIHSLAGLCWPLAQHSLAQICPKVPQGWVGFVSPPRCRFSTGHLIVLRFIFLREPLTFPWYF